MGIRDNKKNTVQAKNHFSRLKRPCKNNFKFQQANFLPCQLQTTDPAHVSRKQSMKMRFAGNVGTN